MAVDDSSSSNDQVVEASISSSVDFVAGWAAGAVAVLCVQPIDTWLTRFQAASSTQSAKAASTWTSSSPRSLWRGSSPMIWSVPMQNALLMGGYGVGQKFFPVDEATTSSTSDHQYDRNRQLLAIFVGGCTGGLLQSFFMSPVELIKVTQQINDVKSLSTASIALSMKWTSGLNATILRDGIPHGVWFVAYDVTKTAWQQQQQDSSSSSQFTGPLVAGAVAATVAWGVGYPADLIKTRIQASSSSVDGHNPTITIRDVARDIVRKSGYRGLYQGFGLKLVRSIPASMIGFSVYELVKDAIINVR
jgi:solute carrier family 25 (mitochondrial carnitine/acylcarnitine transporter), member 20/29